MKNTQVMDVMTENPVFIAPDATLQKAAEMMRDIDCGILPVGTEDRIKGMITDRDIVTRAVAMGMDVTKEQVKDYMTATVHACYEHETLEQAADGMHKNKVGRLIVKNKADGVAGILSFGGILRKNANTEEVAKVVEHALGKEAA